MYYTLFNFPTFILLFTRYCWFILSVNVLACIQPPQLIPISVLSIYYYSIIVSSSYSFQYRVVADLYLLICCLYLCIFYRVFYRWFIVVVLQVVHMCGYPVDLLISAYSPVLLCTLVHLTCIGCSYSASTLLHLVVPP